MRKQIGRIVKLKPEFEESYISIHKNVWPGVLERISKSNIRNYSIFLLDDILFSYNEYVGNNYEQDMQETADDITKEWWKITNPMQESLESNLTGEWWLNMKLISHFYELVPMPKNVKRFAFVAQIKPGSEGAIKNHFNLFDESMKHLFTQACIQNQSVFLCSNYLYVYFEYTGTNFQKDDKELNSNPELKKWNDELEKYLSRSWREMVEVFHTN